MATLFFFYSLIIYRAKTVNFIIIQLKSSIRPHRAKLKLFLKHNIKLQSITLLSLQNWKSNVNNKAIRSLYLSKIIRILLNNLK
jgi:hypothetical protein